MREIFIQQSDEDIREIEDFPTYWASNLGRIISAFKSNQTGWIVLRHGLERSGHHCVSLRRDGRSYTRRVHDLVGRAFSDFSGSGDQWRHFPDSTKSNNRADNLVWGSYFENMWDRICDNGRREDWGIKSSGSKKNPFSLNMNLISGGRQEYIGLFPTMESAREERDRLCTLHGLIDRIAA